jgi:hypothetical protein
MVCGNCGVGCGNCGVGWASAAEGCQLFEERYRFRPTQGGSLIQLPAADGSSDELLPVDPMTVAETAGMTWSVGVVIAAVWTCSSGVMGVCIGAAPL